MISSNQSNDLPLNNSALEHLLSAHADALIRKPNVQADDFDFLFDEYGLDEAEVADAESLLQIAHQLNELTEVAPSDAFVARLKNELTGAQAESALILRWRRLPATYRLAASVGGMTLTAGLLLLAGRRIVDVIGFLQRRQQSKEGLGLNTVS
jgi:hypothetical protein